MELLYRLLHDMLSFLLFYHTEFIFVDISMSHSINLRQGQLYDWELKQKINVKYYTATFLV